MNTTFETTVPSTAVMAQAIPPQGAADVYPTGTGEALTDTGAARTDLTRAGGEVIAAVTASQELPVQVQGIDTEGGQPGQVTVLERLRATGSLVFAVGALSLLVAPTILSFGKRSAAESAVEVNGTRNRLTGKATFRVTEATRTREGRGKIASSPTGSPRISTREVRAKDAGAAIKKVSKDDGSLKNTERVRHWGRTH